MSTKPVIEFTFTKCITTFEIYKVEAETEEEARKAVEADPSTYYIETLPFEDVIQYDEPFELAFELKKAR